MEEPIFTPEIFNLLKKSILGFSSFFYIIFFNLLHEENTVRRKAPKNLNKPKKQIKNITAKKTSVMQDTTSGISQKFIYSEENNLCYIWVEYIYSTKKIFFSCIYFLFHF